jgi:phosphoglycolate phosphatase
MNSPFAARAVLLDLDGTLLDTALDIHAAACGMLRDLGRPELSVAEIRGYVGRGIPNLIKRALAGALEAADDPAPPPPEALASMMRHYADTNGHSALPFPGVMAGLAALKAKGFPLAVITNKAEAFTLPLLERTGLAPYFDAVVSGDLLPRAKPDPMPVIWACGRLNVSPADAIMIGDSQHDFHAGHTAGCRVFLVPYGYNEGRQVRDLACDAIVSSLEDAAQRLIHV